MCQPYMISRAYAVLLSLYILVIKNDTYQQIHYQNTKRSKQTVLQHSKRLPYTCLFKYIYIYIARLTFCIGKYKFLLGYVWHNISKCSCICFRPNILLRRKVFSAIIFCTYIRAFKEVFMVSWLLVTSCEK